MDDEDYRALLDFIRRFRHDANNPLTAALGNVQLLLEDSHTMDTEVVESLRTVESELRRLMVMMRRLNEVKAGGPAPVWDAAPPA